MRGTLGTLTVVALVGCANGQDTSNTNQVEGTPYWASGSATNEGKSTHLFIVNHANAILAKHLTLTKAAKANAWLSNGSCRTYWQQGLDDADHKPGYNNWYTWKSHFYDPSTGTNYTGGTDTAYKNALSHLATAKSKLAANDVKNGCYELGLALHYATDITQPMHAANFAATDHPLDMHSHVEDRAEAIQNQFIASDWATAPSNAAVGTMLNDIAWASNGLWPALWDSLGNAYIAKCNDDMPDEWFDQTSCWEGDAGVDAQIGVELRQAQVATAKFLYAADLP